MGWGEWVAPGTDTYWDTASAQYNASLTQLDEFGRDLGNRGVHLLLVSFPQHPGAAAHEAYGPFGPHEAAAGRVLRDVGVLAESNPYLHLYDAHLYGDHDYTEGEATDDNHLCTRGAAKLGMRIDSVLNTFLQ